MIRKPQLEKHIEASSIIALKNEGAIACLKLNSRGNRGKPDRLILMPNNGHFFIEFKTQKGETTLLQQLTIKEYRDNGHAVYICRSKEEAVKAYQKEAAKLC